MEQAGYAILAINYRSWRWESAMLPRTFQGGEASLAGVSYGSVKTLEGLEGARGGEGPGKHVGPMA